MMFRDDLYSANRRIERAEDELRQARADRDHLVEPSPKITPPPQITLPVLSYFETWEWVVIATMAVAALTAIACVGVKALVVVVPVLGGLVALIWGEDCSGRRR